MDCCSKLAELAVKDPETGDFVLVKLIPINSTRESFMLVTIPRCQQMREKHHTM